MWPSSFDRNLLILLIVFMSVGGLASSPSKYFEFSAVVPHQSIGDPEITYSSLEYGNISENESGRDVRFRLLNSNGSIITSAGFQTEYNLADTQRTLNSTNDTGEARAMETFTVLLPYNSSANTLEITRDGNPVKRIDVESRVCKQTSNNSFCQTEDVDKDVGQSGGGNPIIFLILLTGVLLAGYIYASNNNKNTDLGDFS